MKKIAGPKARSTTLSLTHSLWEWLRLLEEETGVRPSVTVRRILEKEKRRQEASFLRKTNN